MTEDEYVYRMTQLRGKANVLRPEFQRIKGDFDKVCEDMAFLRYSWREENPGIPHPNIPK